MIKYCVGGVFRADFQQIFPDENYLYSLVTPDFVLMLELVIGLLPLYDERGMSYMSVAFVLAAEQIVGLYLPDLSQFSSQNFCRNPQNTCLWAYRFLFYYFLEVLRTR